MSQWNEITGSGHQNAHPAAVVPTKTRRLGHLPAALALNACDIGEAVLDNGETVTTTFGRNLSVEQQAWYQENTWFRPIWLGADDGSAELIIPDEQAATLRSILRSGLPPF